ncbi:MAG: hypothetical protein OXE99_09455 [Cellvibrionales bacterium]|nr:hypothetical protein [Cellvibrionales bacterium]
MMIIRSLQLTALFFVAALSCLVHAESFQKELDHKLEGLSIAIDDIEKDIHQLKKDLMFPPVTRLTVYLSLAPNVLYDLRSMALSIDGVEKSFHIYSERDITSLRLGGIQRFWEGNVTLGKHKVSAKLKGFDRKKRPVEKVVSLNFEKVLTGHAIIIEINANAETLHPEFIAKNLEVE